MGRSRFRINRSSLDSSSENTYNRNVDLVQLHAFVEVVRAGSFTAAARATSTPKSTLSQRVMDLERALGHRLLERTTRRLRITEVGELVLQDGRRLLSDAAELEARVRRRASEPSGRLRVGVPVAFGRAHMAALVAEYIRRWPRTTVEVSLADRRVDILGEGFDCAIRVGQAIDSSLVTRTFAHAFNVVVAAPSLAHEHGAPEQPEALRDWPVIQHTVAGQARPWQLERGAQRFEGMLEARLLFDDSAALRLAAIAGAGAAYLPELLVAGDLRSGRLVRLLPGWTSARLPLRVLYPAHREPSLRVSALIELLTERFAASTVVPGPG